MKLIQTYRHYINSIIITLAVLLTYSNIFPNQFVWDDNSFILDWQATRDLPANVIPFFKGAVAEGHEGLYRPVRSILYSISYTFWGTNPFGYHLQSLLLHILGSVGAYLLSKQLTKNEHISLATGLIFATHPIHVEAITWITPNFDIAGVVMSVYGIISYIKWRTSARKAWYFLSLVLITLAYFTNEITLVTIGMLVSYDVFIHPKKPPKTVKAVKNFFKKNKQLLKDWSIFLTPALIYLFIRFFYLDIGAREEWIYGSYFYTGIVMVVAFVMQLQELFWPFPLNVNHQILEDYNALLYHEINIVQPPPIPELSNPKFIFSLVITTSLLFLFWKHWKKDIKATFLALWHLLAILPLMQIVPQTIIYGERYLYFASYGSLLLLIYLLFQLLKKFTSKYLPIFYLVIISLSLFFGYTSFNRNYDWRSEKTLWESSLANGPQSPVALSNLARYYHQKQDFETAFDLLKQAQEINPNHIISASNLGVAYTERGQYQKAIELHKRVYNLAPSYFRNYQQLAVAYFKKKDYPQAIHWQTKYIETRPQDYNAYFELAQMYHAALILEKAEEYYLKTISLNPFLTEAYLKISDIYDLLSKYDQGIELLNNSPVNQETAIQEKIKHLETEKATYN